MRWQRNLLIFLAIVGLTACGSSSTTRQPALQQLLWCSEPVLAFIDEGTVPATMLPDWQAAKGSLGFTVTLPPTLPPQTCLISAGTVTHDPVFGSRFSITYSLPDNQSLSIAESPQQQAIPKLQCSSTTGTDQIATTCQQTRDNVNITISGNQRVAQIQGLFPQLVPNVAWLPLH